MQDSPKYKSLTPDQQKQVRGVFYDKFIEPSYKARGSKDYPTKDEWVESKFKTLKTDEPSQTTQRTISLVKGTAEAAKFGFSLTEYATRKMMGNKYGDTVKDWTTGPLQKVIDRANDWQQDHSYMGDKWYAKLNNKVANFAAEQAPSLFALEGSNAIAKLGAEKIALQDIVTNPKLAHVLTETAAGYVYGKFADNDKGKESALAFGSFASISPAFKYISKLFGIGGRKAVIEALDLGLQKANGVDFSKITNVKSIAAIYDQVGEAGVKVFNEASQAKFKKTFNLLSQGQKQEIAEHIIGTITKAEERSVSDNPSIAATVVTESMSHQAKQNPFFKDTVEMFKKAGYDLEVDNVEAVVENNAIRTDKKSISKVASKLIAASERNQNREKSEIQTIFGLAGMRMGPGAANINDPSFDKALLSMVKNTFKLENPDHQAVQLWSIRKEFKSKAIQERITEMMEQRFPNHSVRDYGIMASNLDKHVSQVSAGIMGGAPNVTVHGPKVFRSTNISPTGSATNWQKELQATVDALDTMNKVKNHPEAKKAVAKVAKDMKNITKNASGESSASQEAISRIASEKSGNIKRYRIDTRSGKTIPLFGVDAVDAKAGPYDVIIKEYPNGKREVLDQGSSARSWK